MAERTRAQIIATIGPVSKEETIFKRMVEAGVDAVRLNFSWGVLEEHLRYIYNVYAIDAHMPIIADLPGPRIQGADGHTFDKDIEIPTEKDKELINFAKDNKIKYLALSFVKDASDIERTRAHLSSIGSNMKIIAKIERAESLQNIDAILKASDAIMVARGDLSKNIPIEKLPQTEADLIHRAKKAGKPVITATGFLSSMLEGSSPTQSEASDISYAINLGTDAILLTDETAIGRHPVESVQMLERISSEAETLTNSPLHLL